MRILIVILSVLLVSCGGGGGGNTGGSGSTPPPQPVSITVSKTSATLSARQYDVQRPTDKIDISWADTRVNSVTAKLKSGGSSDWMQFTLVGSLSPVSLELEISDTSIPAGSYTETIQVSALNSSGVSIADRDISVTYTVSDRPEITLTESEDLSFKLIKGDSADQIILQIDTADDIEWTTEVSANWIYLDTSSGTGSMELGVGVNPDLASIGTNLGTITIHDAIAPRSKSIEVSLELGDIFAKQGEESVGFNIIEGDTSPANQLISLTGQNISWTAIVSDPWITLQSLSGVSPVELSVGVDSTSLSEGEYQGQITFSDDNFGQEIIVELKLVVEPRRLDLSDIGVGFAKTPSISSLSRDIIVSENLGVAVNWNATSNAPWLTVSPSGQTAGILTLTANANGLAANQFHKALVTVSSDEPTIDDNKFIDVSLWVGNTDPDPVFDINYPALEIIGDAVNPLFYAHDGGPDIQVYNYFTGQSVGVIQNIGDNLGAMSVSQDGKTLYVHRTAPQEIVAVNLSDNSVQPGWPVDQMYHMDVGHIGGKALIFTSAGQVLDGITGRVFQANFSNQFYSASNTIDVSRDGTKMCAMNRGLSPYSIYCFRANFINVGMGTINLDYIGDVFHGAGSNGRDVALSNDGSKIYAAGGAPYGFNVFDGETMELLYFVDADAYPNAAEMAQDGTFFGGIDGYYSVQDVWSYDDDASLLKTYAIAGDYNSLLSRQIVISPSSSMLAGANDDGIRIMPVQ